MDNYSKNRIKNQKEYNKKAREKYDKNNFKYQTVKLKIEEAEKLDEYCKKNNIAKNTLMRKAIMGYIGEII